MTTMTAPEDVAGSKSQTLPFPLWDMTMSWNKQLRDPRTLARLHALGVAVVGLTVASDRFYGPGVALEGIAELDRLVQADERFVIARSTQDVQDAVSRKKLAIEINFQGVGPLGGDLERIEMFARLGVRHVGLAWNAPNDAGGSATVMPDDGLTAFGREALVEMQRVGIIVDGAHAGYRTLMEAAESSRKPFIVSHTNCQALAHGHRNVTDEQILACASTGGVVGMTGFGHDLGDAQAGSEALFRHIDHVVTLAGIAHAGIGLDYLEHPEVFWNMVRDSPATWPGPQGQPMQPCRFARHEQLAQVAALMNDAGYSPDDIHAVFIGNWRRVAQACWPA